VQKVSGLESPIRPLQLIQHIKKHVYNIFDGFLVNIGYGGIFYETGNY
jgi:hypothetical protein